MDEKDLASYIDLAMKNLHFLKLQGENVISEFTRLLNSKDIAEVKELLSKK